MINVGKNRLEMILNFTNTGIWDFDPNVTVMNWSNQAKELFGIGPETEMTYPLFLSRVYSGDKSRVHQAIQRALLGQAAEYEIEFRTVILDDGLIHHIYAKGRVIKDGSGKPIRIIGASRDITEQRIRENELARLKKRAEAATEAKSKFLANMSHEMRTPLGAMLGFAELALENPVGEETMKEYLSTIIRNGESLLSLINEVLDLSKVEANLIEIECQRFSLKNTMSEVINMFQNKRRNKNIELRMIDNSDAPDFVETDKCRFKQVIINLLSNALKFTERGEVTIEFRVEARNKIAVLVTDTGIGLSAKQQGEIFQRFRQADKSITHKYGGSGLGLALSKELAKAMGGDLVLVASKAGEGSTFKFTFADGVPGQRPVRDEISAITNARGFPLGEDLNGIRVLLAEDAPDNQYLVSTLLERAGAKVDVVENGLQALSRARSEDYDVVLMDIQMPELDGHAATQALRSEGYTKPIIALTANAMSGEKEKSIESGFDDHLTKPINRRVLLSEIAQFAKVH